MRILIPLAALAAAAILSYALLSAILIASPKMADSPVQVDSGEVDWAKHAGKAEPARGPASSGERIRHAVADTGADEALVPADFDPTQRRPGEDLGLWVIYKQLVVGFDDKHLPCSTHVNLSGKLALVGLSLSDLRQLDLTVLSAQVEPLEAEISKLKPQWGYEWRAAKIRLIRSGKYELAERDAAVSKPPDLSLDSDGLVSIGPGPEIGIRRIVRVRFAEFPHLKRCHDRIMFLADERARIIREFAMIAGRREGR